ncbi:hypothetical protein [Paenibacillus sp. GCM10012306]|uniref:hypothetical protein n=1 Tax=Paenibacillus sp. GCM10012306 TaxID=3317342 RepID=UPI00361E3C13
MLQNILSYSPSQSYFTPELSLLLSYDENSKRICFTSQFDNELYDFKQIIGSEIIIDEVIISSNMLLEGPFKERVSEEKVKNIQLKITVEDTLKPNYYVPFFKSSSAESKEEPVVKAALEQVAQWNSIISILMRQNELQSDVKQDKITDKPETSNGSVADELLKMSELLKQDLITREEFDLQKAKLLSK